jgi:hypothetical protein
MVKVVYVWIERRFGDVYSRGRTGSEEARVLCGTEEPASDWKAREKP